MCLIQLTYIMFPFSFSRIPRYKRLNADFFLSEFSGHFPLTRNYEIWQYRFILQVQRKI